MAKMSNNIKGVNYRVRSQELLDAICHKYYGVRPGATEQVLSANPGLAKLGAVIPENEIIFLPELESDIDDSTVSLWD